MASESSSTTLTLTTGGITLLGVLLSVGVSVGFGVGGSWWIRVAAGLATTLLLILVVKFGTSAGRGPLAKIARWTIGSSGDTGASPWDGLSSAQRGATPAVITLTSTAAQRLDPAARTR
jgi:hypothetical protein